MPPIRIVYVASEIAPFSKTGGLGDVAGALPRELHRLGHDVLVFAPLHSRTDPRGQSFRRVEAVQGVEVRLGTHVYSFSLFAATLPESTLEILFVDCPALFHRASIYTADSDEHRRFLLFTRAVLESCQRLGFSPHIFHVNDWQSAFLPIYLKTLYSWDRLFAPSRTVLTIHNLGYQGLFSATILDETGLQNDRHLLHQDQLRAGVINSLVTGILYAGVLTTVSPTYAREIQTEEMGFGLHDLLRQRGDHLVGILNGVDYDRWQPETDPFLPHRYSKDTIALKSRNRDSLLAELRLRAQPRGPVFGVISRLAYQKGLDLVLETMPDFLRRTDSRLIVLGSGEPRYELGFSRLQQSHPAQVCFYNGFSDELAHLIEGGADALLMPSRYEPCGLNQMYSLRYGTVPVVRNTGGLADSVEPWDPARGSGTGFLFDHWSAPGLRWALERALRAFANPVEWSRLMANGMERDYSWRTQAPRYVDLYRRLAAVH